MADDNFNTSAMFPNLDQLSESSRDIYIKDHEFQAKVSEMIAELNRLLASSENGGNDSVISAAKKEVSKQLSNQTTVIDTISNNAESNWISQIKNEIVLVQSAYELLYSRILSDIKTINVNIENRTGVFDSIQAYKDRLMYETNKSYGKTSPYKDGRSEGTANDKYTIKASKTNIAFRDTDDSLGYITFPVVINPQQLDSDGNNVTQKTPIKIFEFTPINDGLDVPAFLAEIMFSGDLFSFKGLLSSHSKDRTSEGVLRGATFDSEYLVNNELPFAIKVLYDKTRNKICLAFKFDETADNFTSIVRFDCSVNLLIGTDLKFASPNTTMTYNSDL